MDCDLCFASGHITSTVKKEVVWLKKTRRMKTSGRINSKEKRWLWYKIK